MTSLKYKRRLITRPYARHERRFAIASVVKPPLRVTCIQRRKRAMPTGDLLFLVSF